MVFVVRMCDKLSLFWHDAEISVIWTDRKIAYTQSTVRVHPQLSKESRKSTFQSNANTHSGFLISTEAMRMQGNKYEKLEKNLGE